MAPKAITTTHPIGPKLRLRFLISSSASYPCRSLSRFPLYHPLALASETFRTLVPYRTSQFLWPLASATVPAVVIPQAPP